MELKIKSFNEITGSEMYEILKSRSEVFVVEQECVYQDIDDKDKHSYHLFYEDKGRVVAYVRVIPCGISYEEASIGRVITLKQYRGTGISKKLMLEAIKFSEEHYGETKIRISAQKYITKFYENVGFKKVTEEYLEDDIPHVGMLYEKNNINVRRDNTVLPIVFRGRNIFTKVIPTVCNLENMLNKLESNEWEFEKLKQWEKRSFKAYKINYIINDLKVNPKNKWREIIRKNILKLRGEEIGASCLDMYFVGYITQNYGIGFDKFFNAIKKNNISEKENTAKAIYHVGKGDGVYLGLLNHDGVIIDWKFFGKWIKD